jgi:hypothetical protein
MSKIEILFYSPLDLGEFIDFCILGKPTGPDTFEKDEDGNDIFGVISWLNGWGVQEAHFFHTPPGHPMTFFMALVRKHENDNDVRPWFITDQSAPPRIILEPDIPGIDKVLRVDGELGMLDEPQSIEELLAAIQPDPILDAAFVAKQKRVQDVLKQLEQDSARRERFLAALRGKRESQPEKLFKELNFSLRDGD